MAKIINKSDKPTTLVEKKCSINLKLLGRIKSNVSDIKGCLICHWIKHLDKKRRWNTTKHLEKKSVSNGLKFCLEEDKDKRVDFINKTNKFYWKNVKFGFFETKLILSSCKLQKRSKIPSSTFKKTLTDLQNRLNKSIWKITKLTHRTKGDSLFRKIFKTGKKNSVSLLTKLQV